MECVAERLVGFLHAVTVFPHLMDPLAGPEFQVLIIFPSNSESISCYFPQSGVVEEKSGVSLILVLHRSVSSTPPRTSSADDLM